VRAAARVALAFRERPALLYSYGGRTERASSSPPPRAPDRPGCGYPLERFGMRFDYLFNAPDTPMDTAGVASMARAARARRQLQTARLGMVGRARHGPLHDAVRRHPAARPDRP
jgi:hypothetical protein